MEFVYGDVCIVVGVVLNFKVWVGCCVRGVIVIDLDVWIFGGVVWLCKDVGCCVVYGCVVDDVNFVIMNVDVYVCIVVGLISYEFGVCILFDI